MDKIYQNKSRIEKIALINEFEILIRHIEKKVPCAFFNNKSFGDNHYIIIDKSLNIMYVDIKDGRPNKYSKNTSKITYYKYYNLYDTVDFAKGNIEGVQSNQVCYNTETILHRLSFGEYKTDKVRIILDKLNNSIQKNDTTFSAVQENDMSQIKNFIEAMYKYNDAKFLDDNIAEVLEVKKDKFKI